MSIKACHALYLTADNQCYALNYVTQINKKFNSNNARHAAAGQRQFSATACRASVDHLLFVGGCFCLEALLLSRLLLQLSLPRDASLHGVTLICLDWTEVTIVGQHVPCQAFYSTLTHAHTHKDAYLLSFSIFC